MIRHVFFEGGPSGVGFPPSVCAIVVSVVEASFGGLLMASACSACLRHASLTPTGIAAIAMPAVTMRTDVEQGPTIGGDAEL
jgi:hypothetical protein